MSFLGCNVATGFISKFKTLTTSLIGFSALIVTLPCGSVAVSSYGCNTGGNTLCSLVLVQLVGSHSAATGHVFAECMVFWNNEETLKQETIYTGGFHIFVQYAFLVWTMSLSGFLLHRVLASLICQTRLVLWIATLTICSSEKNIEPSLFKIRFTNEPLTKFHFSGLLLHDFAFLLWPCLQVMVMALQSH